MKDGGTAIPYNEEDPYLRKEFEETLASGRRQIAHGTRSLQELLLRLISIQRLGSRRATGSVAPT